MCDKEKCLNEYMDYITIVGILVTITLASMIYISDLKARADDDAPDDFEVNNCPEGSTKNAKKSINDYIEKCITEASDESAKDDCITLEHIEISLNRSLRLSLSHAVANSVFGIGMLILLVFVLGKYSAKNIEHLLKPFFYSYLITVFGFMGLLLILKFFEIILTPAEITCFNASNPSLPIYLFIIFVWIAFTFVFFYIEKKSPRKISKAFAIVVVTILIIIILKFIVFNTCFINQNQMDVIHLLQKVTFCCLHHL